MKCLPAKIAACLAGACPTAACTTFPINTSCTLSFEIPLRSTAPYEILDNHKRKQFRWKAFPNGVYE